MPCLPSFPGLLYSDEYRIQNRIEASQAGENGVIPLIYDCDNTLGIPGRDVDDGLALLYLLGRSDLELIGITTSFGNGTAYQAYRVTKELVADRGVPVFRGAISPDRRKSEAAGFLVDAVRTRPGEITLLSTGPLSNLYEAHRQYRQFFSRIRRLVVMGGTVSRLVINGNELPELNFSADPAASHAVLSSGCPTTVITGNLCLQALLTLDAFRDFVDTGGFPRLAAVRKAVFDWIDHNEKTFSLRGFHVWDAVAAVYVTNPALFSDRQYTVYSTEADLRGGRLRIESQHSSQCTEESKGYTVNIPGAFTDIDRFWDTLFTGWASLRGN